MSEETLQAIRRAFREYYFRSSNSIEIPSRIGEREFGYLPFGGTMVRHLPMKRDGDLIALLVKESPRGVYASCSYYDDPSLPMAEKGWKSGDLAFDIDCDDLNMDCKEEHDRWTCKQCGRAGKGRRPENCPSCSNQKIQTLNWSCERCLGGAKEELTKLMEILQTDFGVRKEEMKAYFSGNKGYHLSVEASLYESLDQRGRGELANYVAGRGFAVEAIGLSRKASLEEMIGKIPSLGDPGWRGRIASFFQDYQFEDDSYGEANGDVSKKIATIFSRLKAKKFDDLIAQAIRRYGSKIDPSVTIDIHRIFRLPGSLHEKTGLSKKRCLGVDSFDPSVDPVEIGDEPIRVRIRNSPPLTLRGETFGPYNSEQKDLPMYAAVYLMGNKLAEAG